MRKEASGLSCELLWKRNIFIVAGMAIKNNINNQGISINRDLSNHSHSLAESSLKAMSR